jgi:hypothetical protein
MPGCAQGSISGPTVQDEPWQEALSRSAAVDVVYRNADDLDIRAIRIREFFKGGCRQLDAQRGV